MRKASFRVELLLDRVRLATSAKGMRKKLSEELTVPPSRISEWLNGTHLPNAETALHLLEWVQEEEAKQKAPASALTPTGKQTRKRQRSNESKSGPPRKR